MSFGFHLVALQDQPAVDMIRRVDEVAALVGFSARESNRYGVRCQSYRLNDSHPELLVGFDFSPDLYQAATYPLEEEVLLAYGSDLLVKFWVSISVAMDAVLGRTLTEGGYGCIQAAELAGPLQFIDWYQYFSPSMVERWGISRLREGPFYRVEEYPNSACGIWLARSPLERLGRAKAAEYLGVNLPKLQGKNPRTSEPIEIPWH